MKNLNSIIEVNNLTLGFSVGTPPELSAINLQVNQGEIVSLVGPSGCGKSTLLRLIAGVLNPSQGEVSVLGKKATPGLSNIGFVPQDSLLLPWRTVLANVRLPLELKELKKDDASAHAMDAQARKALDLANLTGVEAKYPHQLSGGMRQRAALARALVCENENQVLLLDEPFSALDDLTRTQLHLELLRAKERTNATIIMVTHNIFEATFLSQRIVVMGEKPGRILGEVDVTLDWPRNLKMIGTPRFGEIVARVQDLLEQGWQNNEN